MDDLTTLGDVLKHSSSYAPKAHLFLPPDEVWGAGTKCAVLSLEDSHNDEPQFAKQHGLAYALDMYSVQGVVTNLLGQDQNPSVELLVEAFLFYYDNDAFTELN
ncbi:MAG: hypothetical protein JOZ02_21340 [Acidobacteria bacterium]|nr:hypothetical protein [Acidobacteriota bacterium]